MSSSIPLRLLAAIALLAPAACAETIAETRVRAALVDAGVGSDDAACMARRMVDRLSIAQLRKLERLRQSGSAESRSLGDYVAAVRRVGDAEVIGVTASSAALCASGLAG